MALELRGDIGAAGDDLEPLAARILDQRFDQLAGDPAPAHRIGDERMLDVAHPVSQGPGHPARLGCVARARQIFAVRHPVATLDLNFVDCHVESFLVWAKQRVGVYGVPMQFLSDNAAAVHPAIWEALKAADAPASPYDGDALSAALDARFSAVFGRECTALWVATGTAANCLALATMVPPHGGVVCHEEAHIEMDEGGAPGFYLHGAKLMLAQGEGARLTPAAIRAVIDPIRDDVHQVQPHAVSITQASEYGRAYRPEDIAEIAELARERGLRLHVDGARFANAVAFLGCSPGDAVGNADALSFGCIKNGAMSAEAIVFFDPELAEVARYRRKRAGHLQSKGRFLAAQLHAMLDGDLWLANARHANAAAQEIAAACGARLMHPVEANELFVRCTPAEREALRGRGFGFYDWGEDAARFVTAWNTREEDARALAAAIAGL